MVDKKVNISLVKDLREKTGAGILDCKKALLQTKGEFEAAVDWLKSKGLAAAAKKADRVAVEGLSAVKVTGNCGAIIEVNTETDFLSRNEKFQELVAKIVGKAIDCNDITELKKSKLADGRSVEETVSANIGIIGENINLRRMAVIKVNNGIIASYVHNKVREGMGKIAVLVALESNSDSQVDKEQLKELGKNLTMHIAAAKPKYLDRNSVDPVLLQREKDIFAEQSRQSGKSRDIVDKMVEGRVQKFFEENVFLDQVFVIDGKSKISEVINEYSKKLGSEISVTAYEKFELGEGIEKSTKSFAEEVAAAVK